MADAYPFTPTPGKLEEFLAKLKTIGVPAKIDQKYLNSVGYGSSNSRPFIPIMKKAGLLDGSGAPTEVYIKGLRGGDAGKSLVADGVRKGYADLFATFGDAQTQPLTALATFIRTNSTHDDKKVDLAAKTFLALCKFGDFGASTGAASGGGAAGASGQPDPGNSGSSSGGSGGGSGGQGATGNVTINVNIALSVDATSDPKVYDAFFAAMAKHIKVLDGSAKSS